MDTSTNQYYRTYSKPLLGELLAILKLDKNYHRAEGDYLYYSENENEKQVLDLAGGYGSLLLGHNNPQLVDYLKELYTRKTPVHTQLSVRSGTTRLSKKINDIIAERSGKNYVSSFFSTGSEAVEAAIKHAYLNYNNKISSCFLEQEKSFHNIKNCIQKYDVNFDVTFNNKRYTDFQIFKSDVEKQNDLTLSNNQHKILASNRSFHGKTLGALSITSNSRLRNPFLSEKENRTVFFNWDTSEIEEHITQNEFFLELPKISHNGKLTIKKVALNTIIAIIIEPIIGEGGVHVVPYELLSFLRKVATANKIPLIFDEIQCGFYRTGEFLASFKAHVYADYYVMGKSLGGGMVKISALIIDKEKYVPEFEMIHSSTFAEDDISSFVAIKAMELAKENVDKIFESSNFIFQELNRIKSKYEGIITGVRGDGLMIGISFKDFKLSQCCGLQGLSRSDYFGYILLGYLLNKKNIRATVTISDSNTIRIHPSLFISKAAVNQFIKAIEELCYVLHCNDLYSLISFVLDKDLQNLRPIQYFKTADLFLDNDEDYKSKVGFLVHYIDTSSIRESIPSFTHLEDATLLDLIKLLMPFARPVLMGRNCIKNSLGEKILISFVGLSFTSKMIRDDLNNSRQCIKEYQKMCNEGVDFLHKEGIDTIGLGQFTSIILQNGKAINNSNITVSTGNGFTVYSALEIVNSEIDNRRFLTNNIAVIGAGGNIASVMSSLLIEKCDSMLLVGSSKYSEQKLIDHVEGLLKEIMVSLLDNTCISSALAKRFLNSKLFQLVRANDTLLNSGLLWENYMKEFHTNRPLKISWDLNDLKDCDITVVATNQGEPFLKSKYFKKGAFICDISVPSNCTVELLENQSMNVVRGGVVYLPNNEKLYPKGFPIETGQAFACMCETMIMGFENSGKTYSYGELLKCQVQEIGALGSKNGFHHYKLSNEIISHL